MNIPSRITAAAIVTLSLAPAPGKAQEVVAYEIPGISAWSTGKTYGFLFHPEKATGESLSSPLDGNNTRLTKTTSVFGVAKTISIAQMIGGQPSVMPDQRNTTFRFFGGRTLQPGWTVKSVDVGGNFTYVEQPRLNTSDLSFRVRLSPGGGATLRKVVLNGPPGKDWKDAFSAPERKDYVINGVVAWNAAKKYGFTFRPIKPKVTAGYDDPFLVIGSTEGNLIYLEQNIAPLPLGWRCTRPPGGSSAFCILGQIAGGNMSVPVPMSPSITSSSVEFEMFGGKKLSPGWKVKSVSVSNGTWVKQAAAGSDDLSFRLRVSSSTNVVGTAIVNSITLEGPSNAASFEDAFKNAQNP